MNIFVTLELLNLDLLGQAVDATSKILGHYTALNRLYAHPLQDLREPKKRINKKVSIYSFQQIKNVVKSDAVTPSLT